MWFVYILKCSDETLYTGITTDRERRLSEHNGDIKGAKYTKIRQPVEMVFSYPCESRSIASKYEYGIKKLTKKQKLELIEGKRELQKL